MAEFYANGQPIIETVTNTASSSHKIMFNGQPNTIMSGGDGSKPLTEEEAIKLAQFRIKARSNMLKNRTRR